ncbi:hypothetical protein ACHAWF_018907, partial [Thalassiosira exigua]
MAKNSERESEREYKEFEMEGGSGKIMDPVSPVHTSDGSVAPSSSTRHLGGSSRTQTSVRETSVGHCTKSESPSRVAATRRLRRTRTRRFEALLPLLLLLPLASASERRGGRGAYAEIDRDREKIAQRQRRQTSHHRSPDKRTHKEGGRHLQDPFLPPPPPAPPTPSAPSICTCSPLRYRIRLDFSRECATDDLERNMGVERTYCLLDALPDWPGFLPGIGGGGGGGVEDIGPAAPTREPTDEGGTPRPSARPSIMIVDPNPDAPSLPPATDDVSFPPTTPIPTWSPTTEEWGATRTWAPTTFEWGQAMQTGGGVIATYPPSASARTPAADGGRARANGGSTGTAAMTYPPTVPWPTYSPTADEDGLETRGGALLPLKQGLAADDAHRLQHDGGAGAPSFLDRYFGYGRDHARGPGTASAPSPSGEPARATTTLWPTDDKTYAPTIAAPDERARRALAEDVPSARDESRARERTRRNTAGQRQLKRNRKRDGEDPTNRDDHEDGDDDDGRRVPVRLLSAQFLELDTSMAVINQDDSYLNATLTFPPGADVVLDYASISDSLDPAQPLEEQMENVPGGVILILVGSTEDGEVVRNRIMWTYNLGCGAEESATVEAGDAFGWSTFDMVEPARKDFCPNIQHGRMPTAAPGMGWPPTPIPTISPRPTTKRPTLGPAVSTPPPTPGGSGKPPTRMPTGGSKPTAPSTPSGPTAPSGSAKASKPHKPDSGSASASSKSSKGGFSMPSGDLWDQFDFSKSTKASKASAASHSSHSSHSTPSSSSVASAPTRSSAKASKASASVNGSGHSHSHTKRSSNSDSRRQRRMERSARRHHERGVGEVAKEDEADVFGRRISGRKHPNKRREG